MLTGTLTAVAVNAVLNEKNRRQAVQKFRDEHPGVILESIDGHFVRGVCACGLPVMEEDAGYTYDAETEQYVCAVCVNKKQEELDA